MYPQCWTPGIGGISMKYSYEYKWKCVELYRQGKWPETAEGIKQECFRRTIREWYHKEESCEPEVLQPKAQWKEWTAEEKYECVAKVLGCTG